LVTAHEQATEGNSSKKSTDVAPKVSKNSLKNLSSLKQSLLKSKSIPSPKLLIKDHQPLDAWGVYPTHLVIPATDFTSAYPKMGYLGIKRIFDEAKIDYSKKTIVQALTVKSHLKTLGINKYAHTLSSLDIESLYPSVAFRLIQKVVSFNAQRKLPLKDKVMVHQCLKTIHFGMANCLLQFRNKYFEYDGEKKSSQQSPDYWQIQICMAS
jgi:hypothetical protein